MHCKLLITHLTESVFLGRATDRPELEPSRDLVLLLSLIGLQIMKISFFF